MTSKLKHSADPNDVCLGFPTPFKQRLLQTEPGIPTSEGESARSIRSPKAVKRRHMHLPVKPASVADEAHRNLVAAFENLLHNTQSQDSSRSRGTSSLTNTCLRRVPSYIEFEERNVDEAGEDEDADVSYEIYSELESLGSQATSGWSGLRKVVRAHALWLITNAIDEGFVPERVVWALADVCTKANAMEEAQTMLKACLGPVSYTHLTLPTKRIV